MSWGVALKQPLSLSLSLQRERESRVATFLDVQFNRSECDFFFFVVDPPIGVCIGLSNGDTWHPTA